MHGQMLEIADDQVLISDLQRQFPHRRMRDFEKLLEQSELVYHFKCRRVNGIAAKIAQEILMLFKHNNPHARARQQESEHHPGGATTGDAAGGFDLSHWYSYRTSVV